ncbi:MAG: response regulator transcription factor [Actinomycetota bacterium]|nr:response regulator transcription factor [Actinomycetota bacterium]MDP9459173.1 response regulator transcription factor [Actinomycetota bacterium]
MNVRILVVDDTDHVRMMLTEMLRLDGFDVVGEAPDAATAVELAVSRDPQVVIMDLRMPDVDGLEATRRIRAVRPHQPVVIYTAYLDEEIEQAARDAGAVLCLGKVDGLPNLERELSRLSLDLAS